MNAQLVAQRLTLFAVDGQSVNVAADFFRDVLPLWEEKFARFPAGKLVWATGSDAVFAYISGCTRVTGVVSAVQSEALSSFRGLP